MAVRKEVVTLVSNKLTYTKNENGVVTTLNYVKAGNDDGLFAIDVDQHGIPVVGDVLVVDNNKFAFLIKQEKK